GKPPKVAITAVMRKLLVLANSLVAQNRPWIPRPA
ncbi:IS110 family transposase, partial [Sphingomonas sp. MMSM24]|nr:IS110 family transposase [Sphingomonas lycopersici]MCW6537778.1 IS110 family transposase [Sphingomonas lycopersici]